MKITISSNNYNSKEEAHLAIGTDVNARRQYFKTSGIKIDSLRWVEYNIDPYDFFLCCVNGFVWNQGLYYTQIFNYLALHRVGGIVRKSKNGNYFLDPFYYKPRIKPKQRTGEFKKQFAGCDFWGGSQVMFIDVDGDNRNIEDYVNLCKYKPTFAYYSFTDGKDGLRRFRLVYCLKKLITDVREWETISSILFSNAPGNVDRTSMNPVQTSYGTSNPGIWFGNILDTDQEFSNILALYDREISIALDSEVSIKPDYPQLKVNFDTHLIKILSSNLSWTDINTTYFIPGNYRKLIWKKDSEIVERQVIQGYTIGLCTENYWQLDFNPNYIIHDGEGRRMKLRTRAMIRRLLDPNITPEQLIVNMYYDRDKLIDNSDGIVDLNCMITLVQNAFKYKLETLYNLLSTISYTQKLISTKHQVIFLSAPKDQDLRKKLRVEYIDNYVLSKLYNPNISDDQNLININQELERQHLNLRIDSRHRLVDYRQRKNISKSLNKTRDELIMDLHKQGLSYSQIKDELDMDPNIKSISTKQIRRIITNKKN